MIFYEIGWNIIRNGGLNLSIYPVLQQLSPSSGNQTPFVSVSVFSGEECV